MISVGVRLAAFNLKQIANLTCTDELDLYSIGEKKVALFCCIPDADTSLNYLVGMIYSNLFQTLYYVADRKYHAVKAAFAALMAGGGTVFVILILIVGIIGGAAFIGSSQSSEPLSAEVLAHTPAIQRYASEFGIPEYVPVIQAIMMQESGGRGTDPMQASECPYNTQYPNTPSAIQDADYSIKVGVQYYADCVREAGCESPQDLDKLKLSLQGYNYGNGYISWAIRNHGGYSEANALQFSQEQAAAHGGQVMEIRSMYLMCFGIIPAGDCLPDFLEMGSS